MFFKRSLVLALAALAIVPAAHAQGVDSVLKNQKIRPKSGGKPKSNLPAQSAIAHKGAFLSVNSSALKGAIPATNLAAARAKLNQNVVVSGVVTKVYAPGSNARVLLNFAANYKTAVVGLIDAKNFRQFPDLRSLAGRRVVLSGHLIPFKDQIEIELKTANAIRLVK